MYLLGLLSFMTGIGIGIARKQESTMFHVNRAMVVLSLLCGIFALFLRAYMIRCKIPTAADFLLLASIPFLLLAVWRMMPESNLPNWLGHVAFPVYLMHPVVLAYLGSVGRRFPWGGACIRISFCFLAFAICVCVANLIRMYFPRVFNILFGGR